MQTRMRNESPASVDPGRRRAVGLIAAGGAALGVPLAARAAETEWAPRSAVRIVVPFAPGGTSDIVARLVAQHLSQSLGKPVVVDNRSGANGNIGIAAVANAAPDGHTLLFVSSAFLTNPAVAPDKPPYDPVRQFAPVCLAVTSPDVIVVNASSGLRTLADLIEAARRQPGALNYASPGNGNSVHLGGELLWRRAGVTLTHVPYRGAAPAVQAALSGEVQCALTALPAARGHLAAGTLRALAVGGEARWPDLPAVPTVAESGYPGYRSETMQALFAPAGTPAAAVRRFGSEVRRILALPAVRRQAGDQGFEVVASTPEALAARVADEAPRWAEVAAAAHIRVD